MNRRRHRPRRSIRDRAKEERAGDLPDAVDAPRTEYDRIAADVPAFLDKMGKLENAQFAIVASGILKDEETGEGQVVADIVYSDLRMLSHAADMIYTYNERLGGTGQTEA